MKNKLRAILGLIICISYFINSSSGCLYDEANLRNLHQAEHSQFDHKTQSEHAFDDKDLHAHSHKHSDSDQEHNHNHEHAKITDSDTKVTHDKPALLMIAYFLKVKIHFSNEIFIISSFPSGLFRPPIC